MKKTSTKKLAIFVCVALVIVCHHEIVISQFLDIEGERPVIEDKQKTPESKKERKLPIYIVRNIKAELVKDIKGAIKITWDADPALDDDIIVGRALEVPHSAEKALNAKSIKMVPAGAEHVVIDSNLAPGNYYYVVLARKKVQDKDIELYPNVNYTTVPVVIEREPVEIARAKFPEQVTLIHAMVINRNQVLLTWKGTQQTGIVHNVYRGSEPLNTPAKIQNADAIAQLPANKTSYIDTGITKTGNYYYAVTTKDIQGNEDLQLVPDQSYTVNGVFVAMQLQNLVTNIKAQIFAMNSVKITWNERVENQRGKYLIYRDTKPINSAERLALSEAIGSVPFGKNNYIDDNPPKGGVYYAVIGKLEDGTLDNSFVAKENYTVEPVFIGEQLRVDGIRAIAKGKVVSVSWKVRGERGIQELSIVRLEQKPRGMNDIAPEKIISNVDIFEEKFIDEPPPGKYYYALVPREKALWSDYNLIEGVTITQTPVRILEDKSYAQEEKIPPIEETIPLPDKKKKIEITSDEKKTISVQDVDSIIRETFFRGKYNSAINKLHALVREGAEERVVAKARLFIGRSYIEKGQYRKSLEYLLRADVKKHFFDEAKFWSEYSISKLNGKK